MKPIFTLAGVAIVATLAGCAALSAKQPATAPAPIAEDACGASRLDAFMGAKPTPDVLAKIKSTSGAQTIRVVGPHDAMTRDYRIDRLTISTGDDGMITQFRCV